jgi:hypothetical protein
MRFCKIAAIIALFFSGVSVATAAPEGLSPADRAVLADYARDTWRSIAALADRGPLPADSLRRTEGGWVVDGLTSPTNIAAYLWSTVAAEDLRLISPEEAGQRIAKTLGVLGRLERVHGFFFNWYDPATGERARVWPGGVNFRPFLSVVDNGWLAAALILIGNTRPEFREATAALLGPMDFGFFYDPYDPADPTGHPGLLRGGYWADDGTFSGFHYGALNTEPRIASYIGIARGQLPREHYYRMFRSSPAPPTDRKASVDTYVGVSVSEGTLSYRAMQIVPSWDGTMFEALMVSLLIPEAEWAPRSWGANHPLYVRAQIEYGLQDAQLGYWGLSAASAPGGGYGAYGVAALGVRTHCEQANRPRTGVVAPYASFLALPFAPVEALANLRALAGDFPIYGPFGFHDSVDVLTGQVSDQVLILDQGMILASLANVIGSDALRRGFCAGPIEATLKPLIGLEHFDARVDLSASSIRENGRGMGDSWGDDLPLRPTERSLVASPPRLGRQHLVEGILTVAGVSADIVVVRELTQKRVWFAEPLLSATAAEVRRLIARARQWAESLGKPVALWLSDKQDAFVTGIAAESPDVPHRYCDNHFLRDLAKPVTDADSHAKVQMRKKVRGLRAIEQAVLARRDAETRDDREPDDRAVTVMATAGPAEMPLRS